MKSEYQKGDERMKTAGSEGLNQSRSFRNKWLATLLITVLVYSSFIIGGALGIPESFAATYGTQMSAITSQGGSVSVTGTGAYTFTSSKSGYYRIDLIGTRGNSGQASGTSGSASGGTGGTISGIMQLQAGEELYITFTPGGNGGGAYSGGGNGGAGGYAVDVRYGGTDYITNAILVAAGGGGGGGAYVREYTAAYTGSSARTDYCTGSSGGDVSGYTSFTRGSVSSGIGAGGGGAGGGYYQYRKSTNRSEDGSAGTAGGPVGNGGTGGASSTSGYGGSAGKNGAASALFTNISSGTTTETVAACTITMTEDLTDSLSSVVAGAIEVAYNTSLSDVLKLLPSVVTVQSTKGKTYQLSVSGWSCPTYKATSAITHVFTGTINTSGLPAYVSNSLGITAKCNVKVVSLTEGDGQALVAQAIQEAGGEIASAMSSMSVSGGSSAVQLTVIADEPFTEQVVQWDDMESGSKSGVTVTNSVIGDGYIVVSGTLSQTGWTNIIINGRMFCFKVIEEPDSSNVTATFQ